VRSVSGWTLGALAAAGALAGCSTTMQEAGRLQLNAARIRAGEVPTRVTAPGRALRVDRVAMIADGAQTAFVVSVENPSARPITDLPISVGARVGRRPPVYVNAWSALEDSYFTAHLPVVAARGRLTWVYTTHRHLPAHARPFALVGARPSPPAPTSSRPPVIEARVLRLHAGGGRRAGAGRLAIALHNLSTIPQYQLQVYAFAQRGDRYVAAGSLTVPQLGGQASRTLTLGLLGSLDHARLQVEALPTISQ
jgi:hypothetical protein